MILVSRKIWYETPRNKVDHKLTKRLNTVTVAIGQRNERIVCARRSERVYFGYKTIAVTNTARAAALCSVPISSASSLLLCITPGLESFNLQRVILFILYVHILFGLPLCLHLLLGP